MIFETNSKKYFSLRIRRHCFGNFISHLLLLIAFFHVDAYSFSEKDTFQTSKCEEALPECVCYKYDGTLALDCQNISNFEAFSSTLSNESTFEVGTTFSIFLSGARVLPRGFLKGLALFELFINDTETKVVENGAFDGMVQLRRFSVRGSSIKEIPNFRPLQNTIRDLQLERSQLSSVEGDHLKNLTTLLFLSFARNSIARVADDAFQGTENLLIFDMSDNLLQSLPPNLFNPWKKLKKVLLSRNHLLHVNQLFAVTHPQFIYLDHNNLTDLDSMFYPNMSLVQTIQLSHNPISKVTVNSFNGKVNRTRFLYLDHCQITEFDAKHYWSLNYLMTLDLSYNLIEKVDQQTITFGKYLEMDFTGNEIREFNATLSNTVRAVYLNKNVMTTVIRGMQYSRLSQMFLADNRIQSLESEDFLGFHGVAFIDLSGNLIRRIERNTFSSTRKELIVLDLSRNKLRRLNGCVQSLYLLTSLNLTDNQIEVLEPNEFKGLTELVELYLKGNRIETLGLEVQGLNRLKNLDISYNRIRTIKANQIPISLQYVSVDGNPLQCDCEIWSLLQYLNSTKNLKTDVPLCTPFYNTSTVSSVSCPKGCQCFCNIDDSDPYISVDCSGIGLTKLPPNFLGEHVYAVEEDFSSMVLFLPPDAENSAAFAIRDKIGSLAFSNNNLQTLENALFPKETKYLFLDHNLFRQPNVSLFHSMDGLRKVTLSGNPWICGCETLDFISWILANSEIIYDINETRCYFPNQDPTRLSNQTIWILTDADICPVDIKRIILVVVGVISFFLAVIGMMIACTIYEINIRVWFLGRGVTWFEKQDIHQDKDFDAFISFCDLDRDIVLPEIIKGIQEKEPKTRLFLHYIHFFAGVYVEENIMRAVENSKATVIVLSRNFLKSDWCMFEFNAAYVQAMKDNQHRIIIIKLGDLPKSSELPERIQMHLKSPASVTWGEKNFWKKLLYYLPTSSLPDKPSA